jgi:hypothetical protein
MSSSVARRVRLDRAPLQKLARTGTLHVAVSVRAFLVELASSGRVHVGRQLISSPPSAAEVGPILMDLDLAARIEMAGEAPPLSMGPAIWAAVTIHQACQFLTFREMDAALVRERLAVPCPAAPSPWVCYSVDLVMRYLPHVVALARGISPGDPLVDGLLGLARAWPLSSPGVAGVGPVQVGGFIAHPSLRALYVDRVLETKDTARLDDPQVREAVRAAIGDHPSLAPAMHAALKEKEAR